MCNLVIWLVPAISLLVVDESGCVRCIVSCEAVIAITGEYPVIFD